MFLSKMFTNGLIFLLKEGRKSIQDENRSNRPKNVSTLEMVDSVYELILA